MQYAEHIERSKIVIDMFAIAALSGKQNSMEALRVKIHENMVRWLAHECGHWYMYMTDRKTLIKSGRMMKKICRLFLSVALGALIMMAGVEIFSRYSGTQYTALVADTIRGVFVILLGFGFYTGLWMANGLAGGFAYTFSKSERFARKFEKWAEKDSRWSEVVSVEWKE